jgi:hypothetical protein
MLRYLACTLLLSVALPACSLVTDFSAPDDELYSLDENLTTDIAVALTGDTASLTLSFLEPLPGSVDDDTALLALITDGTIDLVVNNDVTGVNFNLAADGSYSDTLTEPGDYYLTMGSDRLTLIVSFYNQVMDVSLYTGGDYSATMSVLDNDWFETDEGFDRNVTVQ